MLRWMKLGLVTVLALSLVALFIYGCAKVEQPAPEPAPAPAVEAPAPVAPDTTGVIVAPAEPGSTAAPDTTGVIVAPAKKK
jgi:PBP1b-binding outer membrane lipoprotein LpoB